MDKELVNKIMEKEFREMTSEEKNELQEWFGTEEEFDHLKQVFVGVEQLRRSEQYSPKPETKRSLDDLFAQKHSNNKPVFWYNTILVALYPKEKSFSKRPLVQIAAIGLIFLIAYPFIFDSELAESKQQISKVLESKENRSISKEKQIEKIETIISDEDNFETIVTRSSPSIVEIDVEDFKMAASDVPFAANISSVNAAGAISFAWTTEPGVSTHPDGIFTGEVSVAYSQPASAQPAIFDLLTATF